MRERKSFWDIVKLTSITLKEDAKRSLVHMAYIMQFSEPPFQRANKDTKEVGTSKANEDEANSTRKI